MNGRQYQEEIQQANDSEGKLRWLGVYMQHRPEKRRDGRREAHHQDGVGDVASGAEAKFLAVRRIVNDHPMVRRFGNLSETFTGRCRGRRETSDLRTASESSTGRSRS